MFTKIKLTYRTYVSELASQRDIARKEKITLELAKVILPNLAKTQKQLYIHPGSSGQETQSSRVISDKDQSQRGMATYRFLNSRSVLFKGIVSCDEHSGQPIFGEHRPYLLIINREYAGHKVAVTDDRGVPMDTLSRTPEHTAEFLDEVVTTLSQIAAVK